MSTDDDFVRHTCNDGGGPRWGRKTSGCPRCDELLAGAAPREAHPAIQAVKRRQADDEQRAADIREHFASDRHRSGGCGIVCTYGDW